MSGPLYDFYESMIQSCKSLTLSTLNKEGIPNASYAPFVIDENGCFYINISGMAKHTVNLYDTGKASVLLIEDELACENIFARKRITFTCEGSVIERGSEQWLEVYEKFEARFGESVRVYRDLKDFRVFALKPQSGLIVMGFGRAYPFQGAIPSGEVNVSENAFNAHEKDTLQR